MVNTDLLKNNLTEIWKKSSMVLMGDALAMVILLSFSIVSGRILRTEDYGLFMTMFAVLTVTHSLGNGIKLAYAKRVLSTTDTREDKRLSILDYGYPFVAGVLLSIVVVILVMSVQSYIGVKSAWTVMLMASNLPFIFLYSSNLGLMQGLGRFDRYGKLVLGHAISRLVLSYLTVLYLESVTGLMLGVTLGTLLAAILSFWLCRKDIFWNLRSSMPIPYVSFVPVFCLALIITIYGSLDVFLVRIMFTPSISGYFATVTVLAKALLYPSLGIMTVVFPMQVQAVNEMRSSLSISLATLVICFFISVIILSLLYFGFEVVIPITYGEDFIGAKYLFLPYGILILCVMVNVHIMHLSLAGGIENSQFVKLLASHLIVCVSSLLLSEDVVSFVTGMIIGNILILLFSIFKFVKTLDS